MTSTRAGTRPPGYRLPDDLALGAVRLQVSDLDRSLAFYARVLGLTMQARTAASASLGAAGAATPLVVLETRPGIRPASPRATLGLYHFAILLPSRADLGRFIAHLAGTHERVGMADHLVSEAVYLTDPDDLGIEVYADRPRDAWRAQPDGELAMTTDPLDADGLIAAARGTRWAGMPAGTAMGHVHLHVGDLDEAAAFYHAALGLDRMVWSYPGALFLAAGGYHHHLGTNTWARGPRPGDDQARLLSWDIVLPRVDDVAAVAASIAGAGHDIHEEDGGFTVVDPWGTALRIIAAAR
ncbi:MAG: VOC family protein [Acidobacteria bacterium]|nr:VOC family protein [Acidobacteriota bacterium]